MTSPLISVLMPTKNRIEYVKRAVKSVLNQTFIDTELLLLDDSAESSAEMLLTLSAMDDRIRLVRKNGTDVEERRRLGFQLARGKYVTLLDSDDYWSSDMLAQHVRVWESFKLGLTWNRWVLIHNGAILEPTTQQPFPPNVVIYPNKIARALFLDNFIPPCALFTTKRIVESLGGWPTGSKVSDWLMAIKITERYPAMMIDKVLYFRDIDAPDTISKKSYSLVLKDEARMRRSLFIAEPAIYVVPLAKMLVSLPVSLGAGARKSDLAYMKSRTLRLFGG